MSDPTETGLVPSTPCLRRAARCIAAAAACLSMAITPASAQTTYYWDSNGTTDGAGATPNGTWGVDNFWNSDPTGGAAGAFQTATLSTNDVFFSAGSDAVNPYTIGLNSATQNARLVTFKDGTATLDTGTLSLGNLGGITVTSNTVTGATISSGLTISGVQTFDVAASRNLTLNTGTFTRNAGATLNVLSTGTVTSTMTGLDSASLANGIIGPWASHGTGASTRYATINGSNNIVAYTGGTAAATAANVTSTLGTVNYDVAAVGTLGAGANINTLRYTGSAGTIAGALTTRGIMNVGGGTLTLSGVVTGSGELVVNTANGDIAFSAAHATGTYGLVKTGSGRLTTSNGDTTYSGAVTVNGGVLQYGDTLARLTTGNITLNGGVIEQRWSGTNTLTQGSGAGQIQIIGGESGFSVNGNTGLTWNIGAVTWGNSTFNPSKFVLQTAASQGTSSMTFASAINLNGAQRTIIANAGASGTATSTLGGALTGTGASGLIKEGAGVLNLNATNTYSGGTTISAGTLAFGSIAAMPNSGAVSVSSGATLGVEVGAAGDWTGGTSGVGTLGGLLAGLGGAGTSTVTYTGNVGLRLNMTGNTTYSGDIANVGTTLALTTAGSSTLTLSGNNTYTGGTVLTAGTLSVGTATAIPSTGTITFNGGTIQSSDATLRTFSNAIAITGNPTVGTNGNLTFSNTGSTALGGNRTITINGGTTTFAQAFTGAGNKLTKAGPGTLVLTGNNSGVTGGIGLTGGKLVISGATALPAGAIEFNTSSTTLEFQNDSNTTFGSTSWTAGNANINNTLIVNRITPGASVDLTLAGQYNRANNAVFNFQKGANITSGTPTITLSGGFYNSDSTNPAVGASPNTFNPTDVNLVINGIGASNRTKNYVFQGNMHGNRLTGTFFNGSGTSVTKAGTGTWTFDGTSQYTNATFINAGTLQFARQTALYNNTPASWTAANINVKNGATIAFNVGGTNQFTTGNITTLLTNLAASSSATNGMNAGSKFGFDTTNATGGTFTIADVIADSTGVSGGARGLTKLGSGSLVLTNTNTFTGPTTVNAGTLRVNGSLAAGSTVTVLAGATLGGDGAIGGATTIQGIHAPGNSPGVQTFGGDLSYSGGNSSVDWELLSNTTTNTGNATYDQIIVGGNLSFAGSTLLNLSFNGTGGDVNWADAFWNANRAWLLFDVTGTTSSGENFTLNVADWLDSQSNSFNASRPAASFTVSQVGNDLMLNYIAVPEPAALALAGLGLGACLGWQLRRRA